MILHRYIVATTGMLNVIPNVFLTIKALIFNLPPASPGVYQFTCISIIHLDICDKCKSLFLLILNEMIFKDVQCSLIIRNIVTQHMSLDKLYVSSYSRSTYNTYICGTLFLYALLATALSLANRIYSIGSKRQE